LLAENLLPGEIFFAVNQLHKKIMGLFYF